MSPPVLNVTKLSDTFLDKQNFLSPQNPLKIKEESLEIFILVEGVEARVTAWFLVGPGTWNQENILPWRRCPALSR